MSDYAPTAEAQAWHARADELVGWVADRLMNRIDAWGWYGLDSPLTGKGKLDRKRLIQHFRARGRGDVIGLHSGSVGPDSTAKWIADDIDAHNEADNPERNWKTALHFWEKALEWNLSVLLTDSDGKGGYHFRILFADKIPLHIAHAFAHWFFEHEEGLTPSVDIFPKQSALAAMDADEGMYGNWLRLPGRHYKRDHWSRVWNGSEWLSGEAAVQAILNTKPNDPTPILEWYEAHEAERKAEEEANRKAYEESQQKPTDTNTGNAENEAIRHKQYGQGAIRRNCARVASKTASTGGRHLTLRNASCSLGHLIPNFLTKDEAQAALEEVVKASGGYDFKRAQQLITSGIAKGLKNPNPCLPPLPFIKGFGTKAGASKPDSKGDGDSVWPDPIPLSTEPAVPEFPLRIFPPQIRDYVSHVAWAMNSPVDFVGAIVLTLSAGMIGNSRRLRLSATHQQPSLLYAAIIGLPGTVKSPALKLATIPLDVIQSNHNKTYLQDLEYWSEHKDDEEGPKPDKPQLRVVIARNATTESLALTHHYNPRGFVLPFDELAGLFVGLNQYKSGGGNDRQFYLSTWAQETINILRKNDQRLGLPPIFVKNPCISIIGGIQPDLLASIRGNAPRRGEIAPDDGGMDRFLFVWPRTLPDVGDEGREVPPGILAIWPIVVEYLTTLLGDDAEISLSPTGRLNYQRFTREHADEVNGPSFSEHLRGPWAKLKGYCGRLALVLHMLKEACGEVADTVGPDTVDDAAELVAYFKAHARKVHACIDTDARVKPARMILKWVAKQGKPQFTKRDAYQACKGTVKSVDNLEPVLDLLERHNLIRCQGEGDRPGRGRPPSPIFEAHPSVLLGNCGNSGDRSHEGEKGEDGKESGKDDDGIDSFITSIPTNQSTDEPSPQFGDGLFGAETNTSSMRH